MLVTVKRRTALATVTPARAAEPLIPWLAIYTHALVGFLYLMAALHGPRSTALPLVAAWGALLGVAIKSRHRRARLVAALPVLAFVAWAAVARLAPGAVGL